MSPPQKKTQVQKRVKSSKRKIDKIYVQTGRLAFMYQKKYANKLAVIVNVIDQNRALCDIFHPHGQNLRFLNRASVQFSTMRLTKFMVKGMFHNSHSKLVINKMKENDILKKFQRTAFYKAWHKRYLRDQRTDYDRFKCDYVKRLRNEIIGEKMKKLRKEKNPAVVKAKKPKKLSIKARERLAKHVAIRKAAAAKKSTTPDTKKAKDKKATPAPEA